MEQEIFLPHVADLHEQALKNYTVQHTAFLTPAEQYAVEKEAQRFRWDNLFLFGGGKECERKMAFFLPEYLVSEELEIDSYICAFRCTTKFSQPGHRDYLGALMGLGIRREAIGDILIDGETAYFFCLADLKGHIEQNLDKVGRGGVRIYSVALSEVPSPQKKIRTVSFSVQSSRLDAVIAGIFSISRTAAAEMISLGLVTLNYTPCMKPDAPVNVGDILSARGHGKASLTAIGGTSRKGRTFLTAQIYC